MEAQRARTLVISSLHDTKIFDATVQADVRHIDKKPTTNTFSCEEDVNTVDKNINLDNAWHMESGVTNVASSTISKMYAGEQGAAQLTPLKRKLYTNKSLALKW